MILTMTRKRIEKASPLEHISRAPTANFHPEEWVRKLGLPLEGHWILEFQYDDGDDGAYEVIDLPLRETDLMMPLLNLYGQLIGRYPPAYDDANEASSVRRLVLRRKTKQEVYDYIKNDFSGEDLEDIRSFMELD